MKASAQAVVRTRSLWGLLLALAVVALVLVSTGAPTATASTSDTSVSAIGQALRKSPVYVDPAAAAQLSAKDADALADRIAKADKPLFVAVLPADYPKQDLFTKLRTATGITGLYAVRLGDAFDARADASVLPRAAVRNLVTTVQGEDTRAQLTDFTAAAVTNMRGSAPSTWGTSDDGGGVSSTALITVGAVLVAGAAGAYTLVRHNRRRRRGGAAGRAAEAPGGGGRGHHGVRRGTGPAGLPPGRGGRRRRDARGLRAGPGRVRAGEVVHGGGHQTRGRARGHPGPGGRPLLAGPARGAARGPGASRAPGPLLLRPPARSLRHGRHLDAAGRGPARGPGLRRGRHPPGRRPGPGDARGRHRPGPPPLLGRGPRLRPLGRMATSAAASSPACWSARSSAA